MPDPRNRTSVLRQLAALQKMKLPELQEKWRDLYGTEPPDFSRKFIQKRLAYRIQELFYGRLSQEAKNKLAKLAENDPVAMLQEKNTAVKAPNQTGKVCAGTRFVREWNGTKYEVIAKEKGFEFNGKMYRSLSAIATEITGARWSGNLFFGLRKRSR
jgi:hypothetical protein